MTGAPRHSAAFRRRRFLNWAPLGLTYAFLYMGRYNLTVAKNALGDLMSLEQFGIIFGIGTVTYGLAFVINGPLTDRLGGRAAILIGSLGAGIMNLVMGWYVRDYILSGAKVSPIPVISVLYAVNMYFQSFGAVAIVKVNSNWFHVTERGTFSAIFGAIISSGIFLAFDVGYRVVRASAGEGPGGVDATWWVFFVPAIALLMFFVLDLFLVKNMPSQAGHEDFDTGAARMGDDDNDDPIPAFKLLKTVLTNPIILTVAGIEFCSGILRNGIMHWYPLYAKSELVLDSGNFMLSSWGLILMIAGITGGTFAGVVSDKLFQSRRGPAAAGLYGGMIVATVIMVFSLGGTKAEVGWLKKEIRPALEADLRSGDLIIALNGEQIQDRARFVAALDKDETFKITVLRRGQPEELVLDMNPKTRQALRLRKNLVTLKNFDVLGQERPVLHWQGAWAYEAGLREGDVIMTVNGEKPEDWGAFRRAITTDGVPNEVRVERDGETLNLAMRYPAYAPNKHEAMAKYMKAGPVQTLNPLVLGGLAFFISLCVIGSHGLLSGTATMDFGGKKGTATTVGVIDGFVYLGTAVESFSLGYITTHNWSYWPIFLVPFAIIGFLLCLKIWNAKPRADAAGH